MAEETGTAQAATTTTTQTAAAGTTEQTQQTQQTQQTAAAAGTTQTAQATTAAAATDWRSSLKSDDAKEFAKNSPDIDHVIGRALEMRKQLSTAIVKPGEKATDEQKAAYRKQMGVPETPEAYKWPDPPNGAQVTDEVKAGRADWAKVFHEENLPASAVERILAKFEETSRAQMVAVSEADKRYAAEQRAALDKKWGPDATVNHEHGKRAFAKLAEKAGIDPAELLKIETKAGQMLLDHAGMAQIFAVVGREMGEGSLGPVMTSTEVDAANGELRSLREGQAKAEQNRDSKLKNELYQKELALIARMQGNKPIVGSMGRAA